MANAERPATESTLSSRALKLYELEYRIAAGRYENIYKAIWQNFSYMAALSAGILAFSSKALPLSTVVALSCIPLLFWFFATYLPMDHYARQARRRAAEIEEVLTNAILHKSETANPDTDSGSPAQRPRNVHWATIVILLVAVMIAVVAGFRWPSSTSLGASLTGIAVLLAIGSMYVRYGTVADESEKLAANPKLMRHFRDFGRDDPEIHWRKTVFSRYLHVNQVVIPAFLGLVVFWVACSVVALRRILVEDLPKPALMLSTDTVQMRVTSPQFSVIETGLRKLETNLIDVEQRLSSQANLLSSQEAVLADIVSKLMSLEADSAK